MLPIFIVVIGPVLMWLWIFYTANRYKRTNLLLLAILFFGGALSGGLALTMNHIVEKYTQFWPMASELVQITDSFNIRPNSLGFWMMVGFNEEFVKLLVLLLIAFPSKDFQEPFDGILYSTAVALGFATLENLYYMSNYGSGVLVSRALITLPAHTFMSVPLGFCLMKARWALNDVVREKSDAGKPIRFLLLGWACAAFLHGLYDALLSMNFFTMAYMQIVLMGGLTLLLGRICLLKSNLAPKELLMRYQS